MSGQENRDFLQTHVVSLQGQTSELDAEDLQGLIRGASKFHLAGDPSSWLCVDVFEVARRKYPGQHQDLWLDLAAGALGISRDKLISSLKWHENYMRWHDGDPDFKILD